MRRASSSPISGPSAGGFTLVELMIVVAIIGILTSMAVPNFTRFQARARQSEARTNLKSLYTSQTTWFQIHGSFTEEIVELGFRPERSNRYAYYNGDPGGPFVDRRTQPETVADEAVWITVDTHRRSGHLHNPHSRENECGVDVGELGFAVGDDAAPAAWGVTEGGTAGDVPSLGNFWAAACGNIDRDPAVDHWMLSSAPGVHKAACGGGGGAVSAGEPFNLYNGVDCGPAG